MDARVARVVPRDSGKDVPRVIDADAFSPIVGWFCTALMTLAAFVGLLTVLGVARGGPDGMGLVVLFVLIGILAGVSGRWPKRDTHRIAIVSFLLAAMFVASLGAVAIGNSRRNRVNPSLSLKYAHMAKGILQSVEMYRYDYSIFPSEPQLLIDSGYIPIELFYERSANVPQSLTYKPLPNGWIEVGMFRIDWNEASWNAAGPVVVVLAAPQQRTSLAVVGISGLHGDCYSNLLSWPTLPASVQQWNADRAAEGLQPIPPAVLPTPP